MNKALIMAIAAIGISISEQIGFSAPTSTISQTGLTISVLPSHLSVSQEGMFAASNFKTKQKEI